MDSAKKKLRNYNSEDRISKLPDDLIHLILSNMDAIDVIQTCIVSKRWRYVWKSLTHLNFNRYRISKFSKFTKFISGFLSIRCQQSHISVFNLDTAYIHQSESDIYAHDYSFGRIISHSLITNIAHHTRYAQKLKLASKFMNSVTEGGVRVTGVPLSVFNSSSMEELRLISSNLIVTNLYGSSWNLQALTTLDCVGVTFTVGKSIDYFSNLVNLRQLTLASCRTLNSNRLLIISPRLETLTIIRSYAKARTMYVVSAPNLSSFNFSDYFADSISSSDGFPCLERVNINVFSDYSKKKVIKDIIFGLFHTLSNAMSLTLSVDTMRLLSAIPELLQNQVSPFCNLKLLKIVKDKCVLNNSSMPRHAITYLCNSSPSTTIINECEKYFHDH